MYKSRDFVRILRPSVVRGFSKRFSSWKAKPEVPENALQVSVRGSGAARFAKKSLFGGLPLWQYCDGIVGTSRQLLQADGELKATLSSSLSS